MTLTEAPATHSTAAGGMNRLFSSWFPDYLRKIHPFLAARITVFSSVGGTLNHEFLIKQAGRLHTKTVIELARHIEIVNAASCR